MARHYLDHASTSPLRPAAREALTTALELCADPGRIHEEGLTARHAVEVARQQVADLLGCRASEVIFTGGGTEADNAALRGAASALRQSGNHIVTSSIEHPAVLHLAIIHISEPTRPY